MPAIDLTPTQRKVLHTVFTRHAGKLDTVAVYGSRVQGRALPGSDVDLVLFGRLSPNDVAGIRMELEESDLSVFADVVAFDDVTHDGLRREIERWMQPLFRAVDLRVS